MRDLVEYRRLRRAVAEGTWMRLIAGVYVSVSEWTALTPLERHRVRVSEVARRLDPGSVVSHFAAAATWEIDVLGSWPAQIDVYRDGISGAHSSGNVRVHAVGGSPPATLSWGNHVVTSPAQTVLDLARRLPFIEAVATLDQGMWSGRPGGALTSADEIRELAMRFATRRGTPRALQALDAAEREAANVRETQARIVIASLGFPHMRLQERRILPSGRLVYGDLYMPEVDHWIEVDGRGKYLSPQYTQGRSTADIVLDEKDRENEIRRVVRGFTRLGARDADNPRRVYDILIQAGLTSTRPRP